MVAFIARIVTDFALVPEVNWKAFAPFPTAVQSIVAFSVPTAGYVVAVTVAVSFTSSVIE